jgi:threonine synthase
METTAGFRGVECLSCQTTADPDDHHCPDCGGVLDPRYEDDALARAHETLFDDSVAADTSGTLARYDGVLPFEAETLVTLGEGGLTLVSCPTLADQMGVERVFVADESQNPTGGMGDRELAVATTAAREAGANTVALPTTGSGGQSAAAYGARAGLDVECFVPSRSVFANKAMINVHGGEMSVVGGRYSDALDVFEEASADSEWYSLAPFETPYRHEGAKTLAYDLALETVPDAIVHPTGHGTGLFGLAKGFDELTTTGHIDEKPRLYAAQPEGCSPIVDAFETGTDAHEPVEHPDTISGALEIPDPAGGHLVLDALRETDGGAVAVEDDELLDGAVSLSQAGVPMSATGGAAVGGAHYLADDGAFDADDVVVVVNPATANREADILRSHLMKQGV